MIFKQRNFTGGENLKIFPEFLQENQVIRALNMNITDGGQLETRFGKEKINTTQFTGAKILGVWRYVKEDGSKYLVVQHNTSLYAAAWDGESQISSWSTVKTGLSAVSLSGLVWKNVLILGNGTNTPFYFNGVSCADLGGTPPDFKVFTIYAGRIWCVDAANPSWVRFSGLEDMNDWDALNVINVRDQDGDRIRGLQPIDGGLMILKDTSIWPLYGSSRDTLRLALTPLSDTSGCVSNDGSIAGVYFASDNIYQFSLSENRAVADSHTPLLDSFSDAEKREMIVGVQPGIKRVIFYQPTQDLGIVLDGRHGGITTWSGLGATCFTVADGVGDDGRLIFGDSVGDIYMLTGEDDEGAGIPWEVKWPYNSHGLFQDKIWRMVEPDIVLRAASGEIQDGAGGFIGDGYGGNILGGTGVPFGITVAYDLDYKDKTGSKVFSGVAENKVGWESDAYNVAFWGYQGETDLQYWLHNVKGQECSFSASGNERALVKGIKFKYVPIGEEK